MFEDSLKEGQSSEVRSPSVKVLSAHECVMFIDASGSERSCVDFVPPHLLAGLDL